MVNEDRLALAIAWSLVNDGYIDLERIDGEAFLRSVGLGTGTDYGSDAGRYAEVVAVSMSIARAYNDTPWRGKHA